MVGVESIEDLPKRAVRRAAHQHTPQPQRTVLHARTRTGGCWSATTARAIPPRASSSSRGSCRSRASSPAATSAAASRSTTSMQVASLGLLKAIDRFDPGARDRVLVVRGADDPRRAQAPLPRQGLGGARPARPAGARGQGRPRRRRDVARAGPRADAGRDRRAHRHDARAGARGARGVRRLPRGLARPPALRTTTRTATPTPTRSARRTPATASPRTSATVERLMRVLSEREREVLRLRFEEDLTQSEIGAARRRVPDARLAAHPPVDRAPARRGRTSRRTDGSGGR